MYSTVISMALALGSFFNSVGLPQTDKDPVAAVVSEQSDVPIAPSQKPICKDELPVRGEERGEARGNPYLLLAAFTTTQVMPPLTPEQGKGCVLPGVDAPEAAVARTAFPLAVVAPVVPGFSGVLSALGLIGTAGGGAAAVAAASGAGRLPFGPRLPVTPD